MSKFLTLLAGFFGFFLNAFPVQSCPTIGNTECADCYRVLVAWNSYRRRANYKEQPRLQNITNDLGCIYPEQLTMQQNSQVLIEIWDKDFEEFYELEEEDTLLGNNTKVNIKEVFDSGLTMLNDHQISNRTKNEQRLKKILLANYDNTTGAWASDDGPCQVSVSTVFQKIISVDLSDGSMSLIVWLRLRWQDLRLAWNPEEWDGVDSISFRPNEIWNPEVEIWNTQDPRNEGLQEQKMDVNSTGHIYWSRNGQLSVSCGLEGLDRFPYDRSICIFQVGSWVYESEKVKVRQYESMKHKNHSSVDDSQFSPYNIVEISANETSYNLSSPSCHDKDQSWSSIEYTISLSRYHWKYTIGIVVPLFLLSALDCSVLWVSPSGGERLAYSITILASVVVYQLLMYYELPATKGLVYASYLSFGCFLLSSLVCIESVVVVSFWEREEKTYQAHGWLYYIKHFSCIVWKYVHTQFRQVNIKISELVDKLKGMTSSTANSGTANEGQLTQPYGAQVDDNVEVSGRNIYSANNNQEQDAQECCEGSSSRASIGGSSLSIAKKTVPYKNQSMDESTVENSLEEPDQLKWKQISRKIDTIAQIIACLFVFFYALILSCVIQF
eukprot:TRINITY_DN444_c0_g1_i3.p1 TRINITY_DN444_c0_g1~~TRINITY_DN444_c0_g1_i3.p1  ORF type:complete len:611 (-),score=39.05 TRINITY_DN444_c0_g1_i3:201-2033(-)